MEQEETSEMLPTDASMSMEVLTIIGNISSGGHAIMEPTRDGLMISQATIIQNNHLLQELNSRLNQREVEIELYTGIQVTLVKDNID
jgi:hypothetical protein